MNRKNTLQQIMDSLQVMRRGLIQTRGSAKEAIPFGQKAALFTVAIHETTNITSLANTLHITPGAATQHVEALVQQGLVERKANITDRRNVTIRLSGKGEKLVRKFREERLSLLEDLFQEIGDSELEAYLAITLKIAARAADWPKFKKEGKQ